MNDRPIAITLFGAFISLSLAITWWAARRTHSRREFYSAGGELSGFQNGLAIAGDYTSAATFLGVTQVSQFLTKSDKVKDFWL
jgi:cation/acetate symporter